MRKCNPRRPWRSRCPVAVAAAGLALAGCFGDSDPETLNTLPDGVRGSISVQTYDGSSDDLLTAGLGKTGLMGVAPAYANAASPTAAELRRNAIYNNYRALIDPTANGGMGSLYGPNVAADGSVTAGEGKIAGKEYIAWADDGSGAQNVTLMVQVPDSFNTAKPCIVTATSSGSRGVYGAIATAGEWGLKHGCAVAYTDKGTGNGLHDLNSGAVMLRDGTMSTASAAIVNGVNEAIFQAAFNLDASTDLATWNASYPNRVAYKHAHSQRNPEKDWGRHTLQAVRFAFYVINELHGETSRRDTARKLRTFVPGNTLVIASSVSNGGGAALAAAEQDTEGLIDGVAVSEPNAQPGSNAALTIRQGSATVATHSKPLIDYFTYANVYQPCAALSSRTGSVAATSPFVWLAAYTTSAQNRCAALKAQGLLTGADLAAQADEALDKLLAYGWQAEQNFFHLSHFRYATNSIVVTYVNAYGRFSVTDNVCGYSMANTDASGNLVAQAAATQAGLFASGNGVPPTSGVNLVYNDSVGGAKLDFLATSATSASADFALDGALCMRSLVTGVDARTGAALTGTLKAQSDRVIAGMAEVQLGAQLRGKPTVIVAGRTDTLLPINHTARAYYGKVQTTDTASAAQVRYYEVTNAQHFDSFIGFGALLGYDTRVVPLHPYLFRALDLMYAHLSSGAALPPSQVVRTTPRTASTVALTAENVPAIAASPAAGDLITLGGQTLNVPD